MRKTSRIMAKKTVRYMYGLLAAGTLTAALVMPMNVFAEELEAQPPKETAVQEGEVTFSTDYPGVTVKPGGTSTFTLYITNTGSEETTVDLCAENLPEGPGRTERR